VTQALRAEQLDSRPNSAPVRGPVSGIRRTTVRSRLAPAPRIPYSLAIGPALLLGLWALSSWLGWLDARVLSKPWIVAATTRELLENGRLQAHLLTSARRALLGLSLGVGVGTLLSLFSGLTRLGEVLMDGPVQIKRAIPTLALIPLLILWFGIGEPMKVLTIALSAMIPVYMHTHSALRSIDTRYVELAETVRLTRWEFVRRIALPGALPGFLLGVRFAVTAAWLSLVVVEQINATSGVGYMMSLARSYGQTEVILVGLVVYGLLGLMTDVAVRWLERRTLTWRRTLST